jgi:hypothetical protein
MGRAWSTVRRQEHCTYKVGWRNLMEKDCLKEPGIDGRKMVKRVLRNMIG